MIINYYLNCHSQIVHVSNLDRLQKEKKNKRGHLIYVYFHVFQFYKNSFLLGRDVAFVSTETVELNSYEPTQLRMG